MASPYSSPYGYSWGETTDGKLALRNDATGQFVTDHALRAGIVPFPAPEGKNWDACSSGDGETFFWRLVVTGANPPEVVWEDQTAKIAYDQD